MLDFNGDFYSNGLGGSPPLQMGPRGIIGILKIGADLRDSIPPMAGQHSIFVFSRRHHGRSYRNADLQEPSKNQL
jgi:hypothetical protein